VKLERWRTSAYVSDASPIIIGGCARSGTTLLRVMLDSHSRICCGPEANVFHRPVTRKLLPGLAERYDLDPGFVDDLHRSAGSQAEFVDRFFAEYCRSTGKPRWAEKTPKNVNAIDYVFEHLPRARFVHVIRDGRDAVCSLRTHPRQKVVDGVIHKLDNRRRIDKCAARWTKAVGRGLHFRGDPRYTEVRYEDLVRRPEQTLRTLFASLGEPWDDAVLRFEQVVSPSRDPLKFPANPQAVAPIYSTAIGRWRNDLTQAEAETVMEIAGPLLIELGYAHDDTWLHTPRTSAGSRQAASTSQT
jgi:protein-tyrosine sulfotransferase